MADVLPFQVEYAKSARASCKACKVKLEKEELRLAAMVQSPFFDGKMANWYHFRCFFAKFKVKSIGDIANFDSIRWEDQNRIKEKLTGGGTNGTEEPELASGSGGKKKATKRKATKKDSNSDLVDFAVEYAKSSRSTCRYCENKIEKDVVRISKQDYESPEAMRLGSVPRWFHIDCFVTAREELEYFEPADSLPGFGTLGIDDQKSLKQKLKKIERKTPPADEIDAGVSTAKKGKPDPKEEKKLKAQNQLLFDFIDKLKELKRKELAELLEYNEQGLPVGDSVMWERLADNMAFGALEPCPECKEGQLAYRGSGYHCTGNITEWTKCLYKVTTPGRRPFKVPVEFQEGFDFLKKYKYKKRERIIPTDQAAPSVPKALPTAASSRPSLPLENANIVILGKLKTSKEEITQKIKDLGGKVVTKIGPKTACVISTSEEVLKNSKRIKEAEQNGIHVVSEEFLNSVEKGGAAIMIVKHSIAKWGNKVEDRLENIIEKRSRSEVVFGQKKSTMKLTVKGASAVDPESKLQDRNHVLEKEGTPYNCVLGLVDITRGTNSYYKLQIIESDNYHSYWVFRSWGRVGTTIGSNKTEKMPSKMEAIVEFKRLYEDKTGNPWDGREHCGKQPGKFYPLDIDYGQEEEKLQKLEPGQMSALPQAIQELICLIFDVDRMKKALVEFEIDLKKMPLGKLSKRQMEKAYSVLTEIQELLKNGGSETKYLDASNRFYTLIPHDFGLKTPPILNNSEVIKAKVEMLESLMEIEVAYNLLKSAEGSAESNPIDKHYAQLKTEMSVLEKDSDEFELLKKYVQNTHAATHSSYNLEVQEVFKVNREGEAKKYKPFKKLHNRQLLWHGSRVTNFAGILSQGLRIAPPEAPVTGYMFGKGVYFADMVSKSANYCCTGFSNPTGLLLLCEVALGNMYERTHADMIEKLPASFHSTKGLGKTYPNPAEQVVTPEGLTIPLGKPLDTNAQRSSLLYNEFIVYDTAQINIKYLLKLNFNYSRNRF